MKKGLGRGLESLIPKQATKVSPKFTESVFNVEIHKIHPNVNQPRREFNEDTLVELADSIKKYGVLQPILVTKVEQPSDYGMNVEYEIVAGERRWRASKLAGLPHIPVMIKDNIDKAKIKLEVALIENLQREDLNPLDEAQAYAHLAAEFKLTQKDIAERVGKSREYVTNAIRLISLPTEAREALRSGKITRTQARSLLSFKDTSQQRDMLKKIIAGAVVVRDLERSAKESKAGGPVNAQKVKKFAELEKNLSNNIGAPVLIRSGANGGLITIRFGTLEDLNKIVELILS